MPSKEVKQAIDRLEKHGCSVTRRGSGHWLVRDSEDHIIGTLPFSPKGTWKMMRRVERMIRELGSRTSDPARSGSQSQRPSEHTPVRPVRRARHRTSRS